MAETLPEAVAPELRRSGPDERSGPLSRVLQWQLAMPVRAWLLIGGLLVFQVAWAHAVLWASGRLALGSLDRAAIVLAVYGPFALAALAISNRAGQRALVSFWPATGWPEAVRSQWADRFTHGPAKIEWAALLVGVSGGLLALAASPASVLGEPEGRAAVFLAYAPAFVLGYGMLPPALVITLRWLGLVARIHREASAIDPFDRAPIYAFSRLTVLPGLAYAAATYYSVTVNAAFQAGNLPSLAFLATAMLFSIAAFVAPLWGIHTRLAGAKDELSLDVERRVSRVAAELYGRIDAGDFASTPALNDTLTGLMTLRHRVSRVPTWPWPPQLFRGFVSALLLPIVVFVASRLIDSLLP
ncbi:MAG: hypothetical protein AB1736_05810 [Chloroflexota bacterium]